MKLDATLKAFILSCYDERLALAPMPQEMRESLKESGRVPDFLQNLQIKLQALPPNLQRQDVIRDTVYSLSDLFFSAVEKHAQEKMMSDAAKDALRNKANREAEKKTIMDSVVKKSEDGGITINFTDEVYDVLKEKTPGTTD